MTDRQLIDLDIWADLFDRRQIAWHANSLALETRFPEIDEMMGAAACRYVMKYQPAIVWG